MKHARSFAEIELICFNLSTIATGIYEFLHDADTAAEPNSNDSAAPLLEAARPLSHRFMAIIAALDEHLQQRHTAAWLAGYARVTGTSTISPETFLTYHRWQ